MKRTPKGASAPKFLVISDLPGATTYTGTRDQLISLGVACPDHFPEGKKRVKWSYSMGDPIDEGWRIKKIKGGLFKLNKSHRLRFRKAAVGIETLLLFHNPEVPSGYSWKIKGGICSLYGEEPPRRITEAIEEILSTARDMEQEARRSKLTVVKSTASRQLGPERLLSAEVQHG